MVCKHGYTSCFKDECKARTLQRWRKDRLSTLKYEIKRLEKEIADNGQ